MDIQDETVERAPKKMRLEHVLDGTYVDRIENELEMCVEAIEVVPDYTEGVFYYEDDIPEDLRDVARQVERERMKQFHVKDDLLEKDYDQKVHGKIITARWQEVRRSAELVRSRIVAREYAVYAEPNLFAGTPDTLAFRLILLEGCIQQGLCDHRLGRHVCILPSPDCRADGRAATAWRSSEWSPLEA